MIRNPKVEQTQCFDGQPGQVPMDIEVITSSVFFLDTEIDWKAYMAEVEGASSMAPMTALNCKVTLDLSCEWGGRIWFSRDREGAGWMTG